MDDSKKQDDALAAEAEKRDEWRGGGTTLGADDAPGHTLPASESDGAADAGRSGGNFLPGTILPPD